MDINTCNKYSFDSLKLENPKKVDELYVSKINFVVQTPKLNINKVGKKIILNLDDNLLNLLKEFDNKIIELLSENSNKFFEEEMSIEDVEEIYKSSFKQCETNKISLFINKKVNIFNKNKEQLEVTSLNKDDVVICLLNCKNIIYYKNHCEPYWEVIQLKVKDKEKYQNEKLDTAKYLIVEDVNDNYVESDDDNYSEIKKIKIKNI